MSQRFLSFTDRAGGQTTSMSPFGARSRFVLAILLSGLLITACGEESDDPTTASQESGSDSSSGDSSSGGDDGGSSSGGNSAPTLSGSPQTEVLVGSSYSFTPTADDPDGDDLTFSIENLPSWASFDSSTGRVTGTPEAGDERDYSDIRITVSDGTAFVRSDEFTVSVVATATGSASLSWTAPTEYTDGTPLNGDLAGYKVYWGKSDDELEESAEINSPGTMDYVVENLTPGEWYFATTAIDSSGIESAKSNIAMKEIPST